MLGEWITEDLGVAIPLWVWNTNDSIQRILSRMNKLKEKSQIKWYIQWIAIFLEKFHDILQNDDVEDAWRDFIVLYKEFNIFQSRFSEMFWDEQDPSFTAILMQLNHLITPIFHIWAQFEVLINYAPDKLPILVWNILEWVRHDNYKGLDYEEIVQNYLALRSNWLKIVEDVRAYTTIVDKIGTVSEHVSINTFIESFFAECPDIKKQDCWYKNIPESFKINAVVFQIIFDNLVSNYKKYGVNGKIYFRIQDDTLSIVFQNDFKRDVWSVPSSKKWSDVLKACVDMLWWTVSFPKDDDENYLLKIEWLELYST